jgi:hypothetical protein
MDTIATKGSRALDATADLADLLRLAHESLHRIEMEVHGSSYDDAVKLSHEVRNLRSEADNLSKEVFEYVKEVESQAHG